MSSLKLIKNPEDKIHQLLIKKSQNKTPDINNATLHLLTKKIYEMKICKIYKKHM